MRRGRWAAPAVVVLVALAAWALRPGRSPSGSVTVPAADVHPTPFAPDSVWNARLPADAAVAPDSAAVVAELARLAAMGTTFNTTRYSTPVYVVPAGQATVRVRDADDGFLSADTGPHAWGAVPLPPDATPADGTDRHLVVWSPATDTMWEFWNLRREAGAPVADHGARIPDVSHSPGWLPAPFGATASGLPLAAGLVSAGDVARGRIDHALALAVPEIRAAVFTPPATRTDGTSTRPQAPVMGSRFRLDPRVDVDAMGLSPLVAMLAHAAQDHGLILRDTAGAVVLYGEDPRALHGDPFSAVTRGADMSAVLRTFPWGRLQLLAAG